MGDKWELSFHLQLAALIVSLGISIVPLAYSSTPQSCKTLFMQAIQLCSFRGSGNFVIAVASCAVTRLISVRLAEDYRRGLQILLMLSQYQHEEVMLS